MRWLSLLRHRVISRKATGSIPDTVIGFFVDLHLPGSLRPFVRLSLQRKWVPGISPGTKGGLCLGLTTLPPSCEDCREILGASNSWSPGACPGLCRVSFTFYSKQSLWQQCVLWVQYDVDCSLIDKVLRNVGAKPQSYSTRIQLSHENLFQLKLTAFKCSFLYHSCAWLISF